MKINVAVGHESELTHVERRHE